MIKEVRFAPDSALEGDGFEPLVPLGRLEYASPKQGIMSNSGVDSWRRWPHASCYRFWTITALSFAGTLWAISDSYSR